MVYWFALTLIPDCKTHVQKNRDRKVIDSHENSNEILTVHGNFLTYMFFIPFFALLQENGSISVGKDCKA